MLFAVITKDKADHLNVRMENRARHLEYIDATGVVQQAGPFLDADGQMCGSLIILDVADHAAALAWAAGDPYKQADLFESVDVIAWKRVIG